VVIIVSWHLLFFQEGYLGFFSLLVDVIIIVPWHFFLRRICWHPSIGPCLFILSFVRGTWQLIKRKDAMHGFYIKKNSHGPCRARDACL
jgi:hypothetical protein